MIESRASKCFAGLICVVIINIAFLTAIISVCVISANRFALIYDLYYAGEIDIYYKSQVVDGNITGLYWKDGRGEAPAVGGDHLNDKTAYIYHISDSSCDAVIICSNVTLYGDDIDISHFDNSFVGEAQKATKFDSIDLLKKELIEYSDMRYGVLSKIEYQFQNCIKVLGCIIVLSIMINIVLVIAYVVKHNMGEQPNQTKKKRTITEKNTKKSSSYSEEMSVTDNSLCLFMKYRIVLLW